MNTIPTWFTHVVATEAHHGSGSGSTSGCVQGVARGVALFLGGFIFTALAARVRATGFDANLWWIDLRLLPLPLAVVGLLGLAVTLLAFAFRPQLGTRRRQITRWLVGGAIAVLALNTMVVLWLFLTGRVQPGIPLPASLLFAVALAGVFRQLGRPAEGNQTGWFAATVIACGILFPLVQVLCFGRTDYRRPAETAVVFGARVYADGRLSDAVADRVSTAIGLYRAGLVREVVMSGGPGDGAIHETEAMRNEAVRQGVPRDAIRLDRLGLSTADTVRNTAPQFAGHRILAVSEYYHLPRIKLAYARAGMEVFTVPAQPRDWRRTWDLRSVLREVPAFWVYYVRTVVGRA